MAYVGIGNRQDYVADFQSQNFSGDGSTTAFTLNYEAVTGSIRVAVDNVLQPADGSSYTVDGFTLNFDTAPASGTNNITILFLGTVRNISSVSDGAIINAKLQSGSFTNITDVGTLASGLTLSDNILFNAASKGIYLGVTTATASNLLDDYEEGTWTPTLNATTSVTVDSYGNQNGYYTKVGRLVTLTCFLRAQISATVGDPLVEGLPFAPVADRYQGVALGLSNLVLSDNPDNVATGQRLAPSVRTSDIRFYNGTFLTGSNNYLCFTAQYETS